MRLEFLYPRSTWTVLPELDAGAGEETAWVRSLIEATRGDQLPADTLDAGSVMADIAREALALRKPDAEAELLFHPSGGGIFGLVHMELFPTPAGLDEAGIVEWLLPDAPLRFDPVVHDYSTETVERGQSVLYVLDEDPEGDRSRTGFAYGFHQRGVSCSVYSELAEGEITALMFAECEPVVASLRVTD